MIPAQNNASTTSTLTPIPTKYPIPIKTPSKVLFSSVCRPIGPSVGDAESVGYELLHGQITRAQHIYSPRVVHKQFSLDYIALNLEIPTTVLHYPSKKKFINEIKKGYEVIGLAFVLSTSHHAFEMCKLIRKYSPQSKIVLGGYGTVMSDEELSPYCDVICREEGVGFMRRYLGLRPLPLNKYLHPDISARLRIFGIPVSHTAMVFGGLGCPNGCDFCCTSHFFKRQHIRLLDSGEEVFSIMSKHQDKDPNIEHTIIDEDFLLNRSRSQSFLDRCRQHKRTFSTFCFSSVKALSQYTFEELLEMGIDGVWVGYEGKESGYEKQQGTNVDKLIKDLQDNGITVLSSMIVGIPYQTDEIARKEFRDLMKARPTLTQFLIYGPTPGTPFYDKVLAQDLFQEEVINDRRQYYRNCTGFKAMVKHPFLRSKQIEKLQQEFYETDFKTLGPIIFRVIAVKLSGWRKYKDHANPLLRKKAQQFRNRLISTLAILPIGILGPKISWSNRVYYFKLLITILQMSTWKERLYLLATPLFMVGALITWFNIIFGLMEHPYTRIYRYAGFKKMSRKSQWKKYLDTATATAAAAAAEAATTIDQKAPDQLYAK